MIKKILIAVVLFACGLIVNSCTSGLAAVPGDLLGVSIGMARPSAEERLKIIGRLERKEEGRQEIWRLTDDPRFSTLAVGYDKEDRVRYVTAFVDKTTARERIAFSSLGDLAEARSFIAGPHHRYVWMHERQGYVVNAYGDDPQFLTIYTLVKQSAAGEPAAEEEEDD